MKFSLIDHAKLVSVLSPAADAAGRTGAWVSVIGARRIYLIAMIAQGNAATVALTPQQATSTVGAGAKAIAARIWADLDAASLDALVRQTDAASFTTDAALKNKIVLFEIDAAALDTNGGYNTVNLSTGPSNVANITAAAAILTGRER